MLLDESYLYGCELFLSLAVAGGGEGSDEGWREADPCHETVDSRMGCVVRKVHLCKLGFLHKERSPLPAPRGG